MESLNIVLVLVLITIITFFVINMYQHNDNYNDNFNNFNEGYDNLKPTEKLNNIKFDIQGEYIATSQNKEQDDYNRMVYQNQNDNVVPYGTTTCKIKSNIKNIQNIQDNPNELNGDKLSLAKIRSEEDPYIKQVCPNKSLNELHQHGSIPYKPDSVCHQKMSTAQLGKSVPYNDPQKHYTLYDIESNDTINGYNTDFNNVSEVIDPAEFYKSIFKPMRLHLEDERFSGWNYNEFVDKGAPEDIGYIPLYKTNDFPVGMNFAAYS